MSDGVVRYSHVSILARGVIAVSSIGSLDTAVAVIATRKTPDRTATNGETLKPTPDIARPCSGFSDWK
ncbi:MAG: hypothetical protein J07HX5_01356 [halophilic archaeon J07HX5]|nr:MAG: hypothetical protein J07HX5_01356 [halophilic archaeon J07HX5]